MSSTSKGVSEMLSLEVIAGLGVLFGFLVYGMVRTQLTEGWLALLSSFDDDGSTSRR